MLFTLHITEILFEKRTSTNRLSVRCMLGLRVVLCILSSIISSDCSDCRFILNNPDGVNNFNIVLDSPIPIGGIITMEGVLNTEHAPTSGVPDKEFLRFITEDDPDDAPILEIETQVHDSQQCMFMSGTLRDENTSRFVSYPNLSAPRKQICWFDNDGHMKISQDNLVKIQLSSNSTKEEEGYDLYLSGFDKLFLFRYGSSENWKKFENRRIDRSRRISNECQQDCHISYTKITVCSDPLPKIDDNSLEIIKAELGKAYTMTCSGRGAPYLGAEWWNNEGVPIVDGVNTTEGPEFSIVSQLVISSFNATNAGNYTCRLHNKNFDSSTEKVTRLQYFYLVAGPPPTYSLVNHRRVRFNWTLIGNPLRDIKLECKSEFGKPVHFDRNLISSPPRLTLSQEFSEKNAFLTLSCVLLNGIELLDHRVIRRIDADSENSSEKPDVTELPVDKTDVSGSCSGHVRVIRFLGSILGIIVISIIIGIVYYKCSLRNIRGSKSGYGSLSTHGNNLAAAESCVLEMNGVTMTSKNDLLPKSVISAPHSPPPSSENIKNTDRQSLVDEPPSPESKISTSSNMRKRSKKSNANNLKHDAVPNKETRDKKKSRKFHSAPSSYEDWTISGSKKKKSR